jgi:hypothetical protein
MGGVNKARRVFTARRLGGAPDMQTCCQGREYYRIRATVSRVSYSSSIPKFPSTSSKEFGSKLHYFDPPVYCWTGTRPPNRQPLQMPKPVPLP